MAEAGSSMHLELVAVKLWQTKLTDCKDKGIDFDMSVNTVKNVLRSKKCYYTGTKLDWTGVNGSSVSVDRLDATKGYVKGNVVASSTRANNIKASVENGHRVAQLDTAAMIQRFEEMKRIAEKTIKRMKQGASKNCVEVKN